MIKIVRHLIKRFSRVADSLTTTSCGRRKRMSKVLSGHVPVHVGDEMERFAVSAHLLNHPIFIQLLDGSAQEYGYEQRGVLHIPCHVAVFAQALLP